MMGIKTEATMRNFHVILVVLLLSLNQGCGGTEPTVTPEVGGTVSGTVEA